MTAFIAIFTFPLLVAASSLLVRDLRLIRSIAGIGGLAHASAAIWVGIDVWRMGGHGPGIGWFSLDGLGCWILAVNGLVYAAAMGNAALLWNAPGDIHLSERGVRVLFGCGSLFILAGNAVVTASDLGALWISMEATTLVTAPLVLAHGAKSSIEAAWKYLILCGVGIAFALLGTVLLLASSAGSAPSDQGLNIAWLTSHAMSLRRPLIDTSFVFLLLGYGTKAGLFPVHNWLPDAHSESPAPASALLSGALLNCAMVALWRISDIVSRTGAHRAVTGLLAPMGALSVLAAGVMLIRQRDLKRMWAYSSIENMGLMAVAAGLQLAPVFALHALAHSLGKASAFLLSGNVVKQFGTASLAKLGGIMRRSPATGFALLAAGAAVMGAPPFGSFASEWILVSKTSMQSQWAIVIVVIAGITISFVAVLTHLGRIVFGEKQPELEVKVSPLALVPSAVLLLLSACLFFVVSPAAYEALDKLLNHGGHR
ncbi:MAG: proton-conducting transporter membrane subunit [Fimbriimonas sp.]|nr:proton-conducting transporter membrane subunit [Fimbriimonas sp.]